MSTIKIDHINNAAQKTNIQPHQEVKQSNGQISSKALQANQGQVEKLLSIVKANAKKPVSFERLEQLKNEISHDLYDPDIEQLIRQISESLIAKGVI